MVRVRAAGTIQVEGSVERVERGGEPDVIQSPGPGQSGGRVGERTKSSAGPRRWRAEGARQACPGGREEARVGGRDPSAQLLGSVQGFSGSGRIWPRQGSRLHVRLS